MVGNSTGCAKGVLRWWWMAESMECDCVEEGMGCASVIGKFR